MSARRQDTAGHWRDSPVQAGGPECARSQQSLPYQETQACTIREQTVTRPTQPSINGGKRNPKGFA